MTKKKAAKTPTLEELAELADSSSLTWEHWASRNATSAAMSSYAYSLAQLFCACSAILRGMSELPDAKSAVPPQHKLYDTPIQGSRV